MRVAEGCATLPAAVYETLVSTGPDESCRHVGVLRIEANPGIPDRQSDTIALLAFSSDQQLPRPIVHINHRVGSVAE
jgi:hypothetical protein